MCSVVGLEAWLRWLPHFEKVLCAGVLSALLLLPSAAFSPGFLKSGIWVFLVSLYHLSRICPN